MRTPGSFAVGATLLLATAAHAQDPTARVDGIFGFATAETPGCAVGVSQRGAVVASRAYGLADVERRLPLTPESRFDIGSTQKQFTAAAVLLLAEQGRLALGDDVRKHLPELPDYGHTVTVDHLLTHTAGIRDWTGLLPLAPEGTDVASLLQRQRGLNFVPGTEWAYSNGGYELAKAIVARVSGMSVADYMRTRLFEPLGMTATAYVPDVLQAGANAALGYQKDGAAWRPFMRLGNDRGGGAIVSTVGDLLAWNDALTNGRLGRLVTERLHERVRLANGRTLNYARGLIVETNRGRPMVWHSGGAAGFSTALARFPDHGLSAVVMCNFDPVSATALLGRVADVFLPPVDVAAQPAGPAAAAGVDVSGRAGLFFDERTGEPMRLGVSNGRLVIANGPALVPVSATSFRLARPDLSFRSQDDVELTFPDADRIEIRSMEGAVTRYRRAQPYAPTAADLQGVAGRYASPELGSTWELVPGANAVTMRMEGAANRSIELTPVARDTYMRSLMIVRLQRDAGGRVTGFRYDNPVVKGIRFARLADRPGAAPAPSVAVTKDPAAGAAAGAPRLEGLVGEYEIAPGRVLGITVEEGRLVAQPPAGPKRALTHASGTTFAAADAGITLAFVVGPDGRATAVVMRQGERERALPKVR